MDKRAAGLLMTLVVAGLVCGSVWLYARRSGPTQAPPKALWTVEQLSPENATSGIEKYRNSLRSTKPTAQLYHFHNLALPMQRGWKITGQDNDTTTIEDTLHCSDGVCPSFSLHGPEWLRQLPFDWRTADPAECSTDPTVVGDRYPVLRGLKPVGTQLAGYYERNACPPKVKKELERYWYLPEIPLLVRDAGVPNLPAALAGAQWS